MNERRSNVTMDGWVLCHFWWHHLAGGNLNEKKKKKSHQDNVTEGLHIFCIFGTECLCTQTLCTRPSGNGVTLLKVWGQLRFKLHSIVWCLPILSSLSGPILFLETLTLPWSSPSRSSWQVALSWRCDCLQLLPRYWVTVTINKRRKQDTDKHTSKAKRGEFLVTLSSSCTDAESL